MKYEVVDDSLRSRRVDHPEFETALFASSRAGRAVAVEANSLSPLEKIQLARRWYSHFKHAHSRKLSYSTQKRPGWIVIQLR